MQLRAEEAAVVEKAVRLAIESVMNVLCAVNSARTHELQRLVADRERHIRSLEGRVREAEAELQVFLRPQSHRGAPSRAPSRAPSGAPGPRSGAEPDSGTEQRDCEVRVSLSLQTDPPSAPPDGEDQDQSRDQGRDQSRDQAGSVSQQQGALCPTDPEPPGTEGATREPPRPTERRVKQERPCPSPGRVKAEPVSPECEILQTAADGPHVFLQNAVTEELSPRSSGVLGLSELWQSVSSQVEDPVLVPDTSSVPHTVHLPHNAPWRSKASVPRRDQSEEAMRRRRASWRAASRRYYARKMARLQNHTSGLNGLNTRPGHGNSLNSLPPYSLPSHAPSMNSHAPSMNSMNSLQSHSNSLNSLNSLSGLQVHSSPAPQYPSCSGVSGSGGAESWRYSVCDLTPLHHPPPSSSPDVTFISETDLLSGSLT